MAEEAPAAAPAKPAAKAPRKKSATRAKSDGPSIPKLIVSCVTESKERKGVSVAAIKKYLGEHKVDVPKANKRINTTLSKMATNGVLTQVKGTGASGSFKLAKKEAKADKPKKTTAKKPVKAKKPAAVKKPTPKKKPVKKPVAKKAAKKAAVKSSPAKKPSKKVASKKSPKKVTAKKPAAKKPAAKKPAAKKAAPKRAKK